MEKVVIIGSWPAGHTAAIYAARAAMEPLMFEWFLAGGIAAGGQLTTTTIVENYPGFPEWIDGTELMMNMRKQSIHNGVRIETKTVDKVDLSVWPYKIFVGSDIIETKTIIISTWATAKRMFVPGEDIYRQRWISACAVCDGALPFFRNKHLVVVWWWDSAMEEANHLTHFASTVSILVRKDHFKASKAMQDRVLANPKIKVLWNTEVREALGDRNMLNALKVYNNKEDKEYILEAGGLFYAIGHTPNTAFLDGQLNSDETGYLITYARLCEEAVNGTKPLDLEQQAKFKDGKVRFPTSTSVSGVFAAGDVADKRYRQAITSAGTGCQAALDAEKWLQENDR